MIIFDSTFLVVLLHRDPPPAKDRENKPVAHFKKRVEALAASLDISNSPIGVPAPAMAEILVRAGKGRSQLIATLQDTWRFQILPFDSRAAIEASDLIEKIKSSKEKWETWAKLKFDIQITAIAKAESASVIYADDEDIERYAKRVKIPVMRICDLPFPVEEQEENVKPIEANIPGEQGMLPLRAPEAQSEAAPIQQEVKNAALESEPVAETRTAEKSNELQAEPAHPAPVQGSNGGRAESKTTGENAIKAAELENK